ncbi:MAG: sigma-70 family RNA polymerase sigma factor [Acidimicrobiales bacterium]|nr:sigma-70 family RNA polymerase sigma factor [Acidimicrobiales bacterium]
MGERATRRREPSEHRFRALFAAHERAILAYALRRVTDPVDAAEVVAETFLVAWRRLDDVATGDGERPWLYGVARRVLANQRRGYERRDRLRTRLGGLATRVVAEVAPPAGPTADERVAAALDRLSDDDAELLRLTYWDGLAPRELALVFDLEPSSLRSRLTRARDRFRVQFERTEKELQT